MRSQISGAVKAPKECPTTVRSVCVPIASMATSA